MNELEQKAELASEMSVVDIAIAKIAEYKMLIAMALLVSLLFFVMARQ